MKSLSLLAPLERQLVYISILKSACQQKIRFYFENNFSLFQYTRYSFYSSISCFFPLYLLAMENDFILSLWKSFVAELAPRRYRILTYRYRKFLTGIIQRNPVPH